jgi:hypothetical protein
VTSAVNRGLQLDRSKADIALSNQVAQLQAGYQSQLGLAGLAYQGQAAQANTALGVQGLQSQQQSAALQAQLAAQSAGYQGNYSIALLGHGLQQQQLMRQQSPTAGFTTSGGLGGGGVQGIGGYGGGAGGYGQQGGGMQVPVGVGIQNPNDPMIDLGDWYPAMDGGGGNGGWGSSGGDYGGAVTTPPAAIGDERHRSIRHSDGLILEPERGAL